MSYGNIISTLSPENQRNDLYARVCTRVGVLLSTDCESQHFVQSLVSGDGILQESVRPDFPNRKPHAALPADSQ